MLNENFNLQEEFNKRVDRLKEGNLFRTKQLSNFMKFYNEDKKSMVEYFRDSFLYQNGDVPKIMFECLTDVISTTFFKEIQNKGTHRNNFKFDKELDRAKMGSFEGGNVSQGLY